MRCWNLKGKQSRKKTKESREGKDKSYEDYPRTELCEDGTKLKKLRVIYYYIAQG